MSGIQLARRGANAFSRAVTGGGGGTGGGTTTLSGVTVRASYEGGTNGAAISAANSGTLGDTPISAVSLGSGSTAAYSTGHGGAHGGSTALALGYTGSTGYVEYAYAPTATTSRVSFRLWVYYAAGSALQRLLIFRNSGNIAYVSVNASGFLTFTDGSGSAVMTSTAAFPTDQWVLVQGSVTIGSTASNGVLELAYWLASDTTTPVWSAIDSAANVGTAAMLAIRLGMSSAATVAHTTWFDEFLANDSLATGYLGVAA